MPMLSDAADVADGVPGRGWARGQTACEGGGELTENFLAIGDSSPPLPC